MRYLITEILNRLFSECEWRVMNKLRDQPTIKSGGNPGNFKITNNGRIFILITLLQYKIIMNKRAYG